LTCAARRRGPLDRRGSARPIVFCQAIADPDRFACEPKVDGVRGLVVWSSTATI